MKLKVCGIDVEKTAIEVVLTADVLGFIFYKNSPRNVAESTYSVIKSMTGVRKAGVFVDEDLDTIRQVAGKCELTHIQLHGNELPSQCAELRYDYKVIKAISVDDSLDVDVLWAYEGNVDYFLFDTKTELKGGSGKQFNWNVLDQYDLDIPFWLSGGIGPKDANAVSAFNHNMCIGVDINSRFEISPGEKDVNAIIQFKKELIAYENRN